MAIELNDVLVDRPLSRHNGDRSRSAFRTRDVASERTGERMIRTERAKQISPAQVREASRAAGQFQRSALGHLNHQGWSDRMRCDGQRLMDLLIEMGFTPGGEPSST